MRQTNPYLDAAEESKIREMLVRGASVKEIAAAIDRNDETVRGYIKRHRLTQKLDDAQIAAIRALVKHDISGNEIANKLHLPRVAVQKYLADNGLSRGQRELSVLSIKLRPQVMTQVEKAAGRRGIEAAELASHIVDAAMTRGALSEMLPHLTMQSTENAEVKV